MGTGVSPFNCVIVLFIAIGILLLVFGIGAFVQYANLHYFYPSLGAGVLGVAFALSLGGIFLIVLPPMFMKILSQETGRESDEDFPDEVGDIPDLSMPHLTRTSLSGADSPSVFARTGDPSPLYGWVKSTHRPVSDLGASNEQIKAPPQLSLEELTRRLKGLEIRVGKLRKRVINSKPLETKELLDSITVEDDVRACLLAALEDQHAKGEISDDFYRRKYAQLKPAED